MKTFLVIILVLIIIPVFKQLIRDMALGIKDMLEYLKNNNK